MQVVTDSCCGPDLSACVCRPLINVCDRFDMVGDLTHYLYSNNMLRYIEGYVQKVNPGKAPQVVGALLDAEASDEFVNNLILSVRSLIPVEQLCAEVEQRNRSVVLQNLWQSVHLLPQSIRTLTSNLDTGYVNVCTAECWL